MTKGTFADRIGIHRNTVTNLLDSSSCDSQLLYKISKVLAYDFFGVFSEDLRTKAGKTMSVVSEPPATYAAKTKQPMRIVIELDSEDPGQKTLALDLMGQLKEAKVSKRKG